MNKSTFAFVVVALVAPAAFAHPLAGTPDRFCTGPTATHDYVGPATGNYQDGNSNDCNGDGVPGEFDGDPEWGMGGALLAVNSRAFVCHGIVGHHSSTVTVSDAVFGGAVGFSVTADWGPTGLDSLFPCGDSLVDACDPSDPTEVPDVTCNPRDGELDVPPASATSPDNTATAPFGPGADGTYVVAVHGGTLGHIES